MSYLQHSALHFLDAILPRRCVGCNAYDTWICASCVHKALHTQIVHPSQSWQEYSGISQIITLGAYGDPFWRMAIGQLKFAKIRGIAPVLGTLLAQAITQHQAKPSELVIIPAPMHPKRKKERGFNQSLLLSKAIQATVGGHILESAVIRVTHTSSQTTFSHEERQHRMKGIFAASPHASFITGKSVMIIDDVVTTGATAAEIGHILLPYRPASIHLAAVAHGS